MKMNTTINKNLKITNNELQVKDDTKCQYKLVLVPRYKVLQGDVAKELKEIFQRTAEKYEYEIIEMEVMPDHVHLFVGAKLTAAPSDIVRTFKSISAIELFKKFYALKNFYSRCGSLWSEGKFISTIGFVSADTIKRYIQEQKEFDEDE